LANFRIHVSMPETLMRTMGLQANYRRPRTSKPALGHRVYPYLLGGMEITRPNQVWAADITYIPYIPMAGASTTWWPSWTGTLGTWWPGTCPTPWTLISVSRPWKRRWAREGRRCSTLTKGASSPARPSPDSWSATGSESAWTGKGGYSDNIFVERLWRTVKYEEVYLKAYSNGR
jgi:putative transposase